MSTSPQSSAASTPASPPRRRWLLKTLLVVAALLAVFAVVVALQPPTFTISRATTIAAPPGDVFPEVNDFHRWAGWSPWEKLDKQLQRTFAGSEAGQDAVYSWSGNAKVGKGTMTIVESVPDERIVIRLEFQAPMEATSQAEFKFTPEGEGTRVTWTMTGRKAFVEKFFHMIMDVDQMVGADFESGLAELKAIAEAKSK